MNKTALFKKARDKNWTPSQFGYWLTGPPHNITPVEATALMREYQRGTPVAKKPAQLPCLKSNPNALREDTSKPNPDYVTPPAALCDEILNPVPRLSIINRSAVKQYALKCSAEKRAGKFTRVSGEFLDSVEANLEAIIRGLAQDGEGPDVTAPDPEADWMVNGRTLRCAEEKLNLAVRAIVSGKVRRHPSVGCTLK